MVFVFVKKIFIGLWANIVSTSNKTKCVFLRNQKGTAVPASINFHRNEYTLGLHYYLFAVNFDRYVRRWNSLYDLCNKLSVPNKTEDLNLSVFTMITGVKE